MLTFLAIIGVLSIVQFTARLTAICLIRFINRKNKEEFNPIYWLSCDKYIETKQEFGEIHFFPTLSFMTTKKEFTIVVRWFNLSYNVVYYYKHAGDV